MRLFTHTQKKNEIKKELDVGLHHPVRLWCWSIGAEANLRQDFPSCEILSLSLPFCFLLNTFPSRYPPQSWDGRGFLNSHLRLDLVVAAQCVGRDCCRWPIRLAWFHLLIETQMRLRGVQYISVRARDSVISKGKKKWKGEPTRCDRREREKKNSGSPFLYPFTLYRLAPTPLHSAIGKRERKNVRDPSSITRTNRIEEKKKKKWIEKGGRIDSVCVIFLVNEPQEQTAVQNR